MNWHYDSEFWIDFLRLEIVSRRDHAGHGLLWSFRNHAKFGSNSFKALV